MGAALVTGSVKAPLAVKYCNLCVPISPTVASFASALNQSYREALTHRIAVVRVLHADSGTKEVCSLMVKVGSNG